MPSPRSRPRPGTSSALAPRALDHLVLCVRDLHRASAALRRLGFLVGARNAHPWGTENALVQLPGAFLELLSLAPGAHIPPPPAGVKSFGCFAQDFLARGEGLAMVALQSEDAHADHRSFAAAALGDHEVFSFSREGRRADGAAVTVAFDLAFADCVRAPDVFFFTCHHRRPENFWSADLQRHPNGAVALAGTVLVTEQPRELEGFLCAFGGGARDGDEALRVLAPGAFAELLGSPPLAGPARLAAARVAVRDLALLERLLRAKEVPFSRSAVGLVVHVCGTALLFEAALPALALTPIPIPIPCGALWSSTNV